jgi:cysteinyl-tRNA synthetase
VYFDTEKYDRIYGYTKLVPNFQQQSQISTIPHHTSHSSSANREDEETPHTHKHSERDFALWKLDTSLEEISNASADGYGWASPWGWGRPGWHIECSSMICSVFGSSLAIHAGGIDLSFPHHANEIVQCVSSFPQPHHSLNSEKDSEKEIRKETPEWPRIFLHIGHLHINGRKMSKSLKNFISVAEYFSNIQNSANRFRYFCLLHHYRSDVELSDGRLSFAGKIEKIFDDFLIKSKSYLKVNDEIKKDSSHNSLKWSEKDFEWLNEIQMSDKQILSHLTNDFNTPAALKILISLCSKIMVRMGEGEEKEEVSEEEKGIRKEIVMMVSDLIERYLLSFGFFSFFYY